MTNLKLTAIVSGLFIFSACGTDSDRETAGQSTLVSDQGSVAALTVQIDDALSILSETSDSSEGLALQRPSRGDTWEKSCELVEGGVSVSIVGDFERSQQRENRRFSVEKSKSGAVAITRLWQHDSLELACDSRGKSVAIDFKSADVVGLSASLKVEKSGEANITKTLQQSSETKEFSSKMSLSAERQINWQGFDESSADHYQITKQISSESVRSRSIQKPDGSSTELSLSLSISTEDPLIVETLRSKVDGALAAKKIVSGTVTGVNAAKEKIVTGFSDVNYSFTSDGCLAVSGEILASTFAKDAAEASRKLQIVVSDGEYTVTDITDPADPQDVADFDFEACELADFKK